MAEETGTPAEGGKPDEGGKPEGDKTFTQAELNQVVQDRLTRERGKYADYDAIKEKASKFDEYEEKNRSATEKAIEKARKEERAEAEAEFNKTRRSDHLQVAVARHARELADVDDVVLNLEKGDTDGLFDKDGKVDPEALKSALFGKGSLLEQKPHLKAQGVGKPPGDADGGKGEGGEGGSFNDMLRQSAGFR